MSAHSFDVSVTDFQQVVMDGSHTVPVVVDFWAPWCGPCRTLKPMLENLAEEFQGKFILAKVNSDENQALATQFGVRGIPSVKAVVNGQIVDEFSGALPESEVRAFLARLLPSPAEALRQEAAQLRAAGDLAGALQKLGEASQIDIANEAIRVDAADILLELGETDEARRLLDSLGPALQASDAVLQLRTKLSFAQNAGGDLDALRARIAEHPDDMQARLDLANAQVANHAHEAGLETLLEMVVRDKTWNDGAARKQMLAVFNLLGADPLVAQYRRKLASALN
jgi:putative thioredoxin